MKYATPLWEIHGNIKNFHTKTEHKNRLEKKLLNNSALYANLSAFEE